MSSMWTLLRERRFLPMFLTMLGTAVNDNLVKKGLALYVVYQASLHAYYSILWTSLISGIFMVPFFLLSFLGGQWADRYTKAAYIQWVKLTEIVIVALVCCLLHFSMHPIYSVFAVFLMGCHSALFGTAKYAYLPEYLKEEELLAGNSLLEAFTLVGIVLGISMSYVIQWPGIGIQLLSICMISASVFGYWAALWIPSREAADRDLVMNWSMLRGTQSVVDYVHENPHLWASILGISWFWFLGTFFLEQLPNYVRYSLGVDAEAAVLMNLVSTIGIGLGSLGCHRLLKGQIDLRATPVTLLLVSLFGFHFYLGSSPMGSAENPVNFAFFLGSLQAWRLMFDLFALCFCCGIYVVPLYARLQSLSEPSRRSRIMAAFNIISSLWMVAANLVHMVLVTWLGMRIESAVMLMMWVNLAIALYLIRMVPFAMIRPWMRRLLQRLFRVEIQGLEHLEHLPERVIVICNHVSYLDVPLLACFLPGEYCFAIDSGVSKKFYMRFIKHLSQTYEVDPSNAMKMKSLIQAVRDGKRCIIFPEGRLSDTGHLMKIYDGVILLAEMSKAAIVTVHLSGVERFFMARAKGQPKSLFPKIDINILPPQNLPVFDAENRRELQKQWVFDQMVYARVSGQAIDNIYEMLRRAVRDFGGRRVVLEDATKDTLTHRQLLLRAEILSLGLARILPKEKNVVAVLLPNVNSQVVLYVALYRLGYAPAVLNYTAGDRNMLSACLTAQVSMVLTSHAFIEKAKLQESVEFLKSHGQVICYLEDLRAQLGLKDRLQGLVRSWLQGFQQTVSKTLPHQTAVILFTSGSEGHPKGVVLSHGNILYNLHQSMSLAGLNPTDVIFNVLPMFHSFGFTLGTFAALMTGCKVYLYPNPKHYHQIAELIYATQATVMIGTNTFLASYQKVADVMDFQSLRLVFAGGEKLSQETRQRWQERFGIRILEGYGVTECSPVVAINAPAYAKSGSVGRLLPGMQAKLLPFYNNEESGILALKGPNLMQGYLYADHPGVLHPPEEWYNTGDVVTIDALGFITIVDRVKRFAKIGGEMISLTAIEHEIGLLWPDERHALLARPDPNTGERVVLCSTRAAVCRRVLIEHFAARGLASLGMPLHWVFLDEMPLLGSGKIDYQALHRHLLDMEEIVIPMHSTAS